MGSGPTELGKRPTATKENIMATRQWSDLKPEQQSGIRLASVVQFALAVAAWVDLARRPAEQVNGRKALWAAAIGINFVGPIAYFARGRLPHA